MSTIIRYNPLREAMSLSRQMDRLMEGAMRGSELWDGSMDWALPLDVIENDNEFVVKASLPGIKPEDIEVTYHNQTLTIKGEMKQEEISHRREISPARAPLWRVLSQHHNALGCKW